MAFLYVGNECHWAHKPKASSGHHFILVAIDYSTKWVEASSYVSQPTLWREGEAKQKGVSSREENVWIRHQRLFEENVRKNKKMKACEF